jgi:hypothetical protein
MLPDRFNQLKPNPAIAVERDSRIAAVRCFRELSLDTEFADSRADSRPPRIGTGAMS